MIAIEFSSFDREKTDVYNHVLHGFFGFLQKYEKSEKNANFRKSEKSANFAFSGKCDFREKLQKRAFCGGGYVKSEKSVKIEFLEFFSKIKGEKSGSDSNFALFYDLTLFYTPGPPGWEGGDPPRGRGVGGGVYTPPPGGDPPRGGYPPTLGWGVRGVVPPHRRCWGACVMCEESELCVTKLTRCSTSRLKNATNITLDLFR